MPGTVPHKSPRGMPVEALTRAEFADAVKDALRHHTQTDLLAENALLRARLVRRAAPL